MQPRTIAALTLAILLLPTAPAFANQDPAADPGIPTVVLIDQSLAVLNYLSPSMSGPYQRVDTSHIPAAYNYSASSVIGAGLGGMIAETKMREDAQLAANLAVKDLVEPLGKTGLQTPVRQAFRDALPQHGMASTAVLFTGGLKLDRKQFARIPAAKQSERFMLVGVGEEAVDIMSTPVAMDVSLRQMRLALDIEIREGRFDRSQLVSRRDVVYYGPPLPEPETGDTLDLLAADGHARFRAELTAAVAASLALATADSETPDVGKDDVVGVVNELGLMEFPGVLLGDEDGRALIWTRRESLLSVPFDKIVQGEDLVAARLAEAKRSKPGDVISTEAVEAMGGTDTAPDAAPAEPEA